MVSTKAQIAKDKGNAAFKVGVFPTAIGHYTDAILADPSDPTLPLNRAAAYLKLNKYEDAERDCTIVLALQAHNVKALYRRGLARLAQMKVANARDDLSYALSLDPDNDSIKQELTRALQLLEKAAQRSVAPSPLSVPPKRRRVPITVVESLSPGPLSTSSSQKLSRSTPIIGLDPVPSRIQACSEQVQQTSQRASFPAKKVTRDNTKPTLVGGGIFRRSGEHTVLDSPGVPPVHLSSTPTAAATATTSPPPFPDATVHLKSPITLFDFIKSWNALRLPAERWQLLNKVPSASLPSMFQSSLDATLLVSITKTLLFVLDDDPANSPKVKEYILGLQKVPRFGTVILLMTKGERDLVNAIRHKLQLPIL